MLIDNKYYHLTDKDRVFIRIMLEKRYPKAKTAKILDVDRSTCGDFGIGQQ